MTQLYRLALVVLITLVFLTGCAIKAPWDIKPKSYLDYASEAIERRDWEAAYRLLENSLVTNDTTTRDLAYNLLEQYPLIRQGANTSFSGERMRELSHINDRLAWSIEKERLAIYQRIIASPAEYEEAKNNYVATFGRSPDEMPVNGTTILPAMQLDRPMIPCGATDNIVVRLGHAQEPKPPRKQKGFSTPEFIGVNLGIVVVSVAAAVPTWGMSLVAGSLALATEAVVIVGVETLEKADRNTIVQAFRNTDFRAMTEKALRQQDSRRHISTQNLGCKAELVINHYGIEKDGCFMVDAALLLFQRENEIYRSHLIIDRQQHSEDAPDVICGSWKNYSSNNGLLLEQTAESYAQALANMVSQRFVW